MRAFYRSYISLLHSTFEWNTVSERVIIRGTGLVCLLCICGKYERQPFTPDNGSAFMWLGNSKSCVVSCFCFCFNLASYPNGGGSEERKKGRRRGIEGVASIVNEKITVASPVERMPSRNDLALLEPANTSRELGSKYS